MDLSIGIAFIGGLASFVSPCVFPLVPAYIGYLSGRAINASEATSNDRWKTVSHGLAFILGFSVVFITLGLAFSAIGGLLDAVKDALAKVGGLVVILFGIHMTGLIRFKFLEYDLRRMSPLSAKYGYLSSFLMGIFFSAGWSPCIGPVLAAILTLAMNSGNLGQGALLLGFYSLGLGLPFLVAAFGLSWVTGFLAKHRKALRVTEIIMGVILITIGLMLISNTFSLIAQYSGVVIPGL